MAVGNLPAPQGSTGALAKRVVAALQKAASSNGRLKDLEEAWTRTTRLPTVKGKGLFTWLGNSRKNLAVLIAASIAAVGAGKVRDILDAHDDQDNPITPEVERVKPLTQPESAGGDMPIAIPFEEGLYDYDVGNVPLTEAAIAKRRCEILMGAFGSLAVAKNVIDAVRAFKPLDIAIYRALP